MKMMINMVMIVVMMFAVVEVAHSEFIVIYPPVQNGDQRHQATLDMYKQSKILDFYVQVLNKLIRVPQKVAVVPTSCGTANAFYDPKQHAIFLCYELVDDFFDLFRQTAASSEELVSNVIGVTTFVFFHEAGHALIAELNLPTVGREEDAVDQFSALLLANPEMEWTLISGASWFSLKTQRENIGLPGLAKWFMGSDLRRYADEHSLDEQRFYNVVCLVYGRDPNGHSEYIPQGSLTPERAQRCPSEYAKIMASWGRLLTPYAISSPAR